MANNADERIILDTEIDSQGFKKGSAEMQRAIKSLGKKLEGLGPVFEQALSGNEKAVQKFGNTSKALRKKIADIEKEMKRLGAQQLPTEDFTFLEKQIEKASRKLEQLTAKEEKMTNTKVSPRSNAWTSLYYDIEQTKKQLAEYNLEMEGLKKYGGATVSGSETAQYQALAESLREAKNELSQMELEGGNMSNTLSGKLGAVFSRIKNDLTGVKTAMQEAEPLSTQMLRGFAAVLDPIMRMKEGLEQALWASKPFWDKLNQIEATVKSKASAAKESLKAIFQDPKATAQSLVSSIQSGFDTVKSKATDVGNSIKYAFQNPRETIATLVGNAAMGVRNIEQKFRELGPSIKAGFGNAASSLNQKLGQVVAGVRAIGGNIRGYVVAGLGAAVRGAGQLAVKIGGAALNGVKRLGSAILSGVVNGLKKAVNAAKNLVKNLGGRLLSGIKRASSGFRGMRKSADGITKKLTRMGLALLGMRGIWGGIRQLVTSALNNNEKLQNQLTAVKGVLGQALTPAINVLVKGLGQIVTFADKIYQIFTGTSLIAQYNAAAQQKAADSIKDQNKQAKELKRQLAGFDSLNILSDSSSDSSSSSDSGETAALFQATDISGWLSDIITQIKNGDWYSVGETIAGGINSALAKINWTDIQNKVNTFCTNLGKAVNGFVDALDWEQVGNTIGEGINTITGAINSFVDTVDWENLGSGIATSLNGMVDKIDPEALGKALTAKLKIITNTLHGFLFGTDDNEAFNFSNLGTKIGQTISAGIKNIDTKKIAENITGLVSGFGDTISSAIDNINWNDGEDSVVGKIETFFKNLDWGKMFTSVMTAAGKALGGLGSVVIQLLKDAWTSWKETYIDPAVEEAGGNIIKGVFIGIGNWLKDVGTWFVDNVFNPFIEGFKSTFNIHSPSKDKDILSLGSNLIEGVFNGIIEWLKGIETWFQENVFGKITEAWSGFKELTISIGGKIQETFTNAKAAWDDIKEKGKNALATLKGKLDSTFNTLKTKWDSIKEKGKTAKATIKGAIDKGFNTLKTKWDSIKSKTNWNTIKGSVTKSFTNAKNKWDGIKSKVSTLTANLKDGVTAAFEKIINGIIDGINWLTGKINKLIPGDSHDIGRIDHVKLAKGGIANNRGPGVPAIVGEAGPEAVLPLNKRTLGMLASLIMEQVKNSVFANLTSSIQQALQSVARSKPTVSHIGDSALTASLDGISSSIDSGFSKVASQLQAIANGVNFRIPEAVNLIPYKNRGAGDIQFEQITKMLDMSNEELISVLIQLFNNQTREIVNALKSLKLIVPYDKKQQVQDVIDEINRRIRVTKNNPLLT